MKIFIDTEFTDFIDCELISIGLVSDDNRQFYGERNDFNPAGCNQFVKEVVLPKLGRKRECIYNKAGLGRAVREWLMQFKEVEAVICFDFVGDWGLLFDLLDRDVPDFIQTRNVRANINDQLFEHFMLTLFKCDDHHALHDAICNKLAYVSNRNR
ncbi:MAG: hypothetical protein ACXWJZ_04895 [Burkholderiaceae bacterium]